MFLSNWAFLGDTDYYDKKLESLATTELPEEKWENSTRKYGKYGILRSYLNYTFEKLWNERNEAPEDDKQFYVYLDDNVACFNTGLFNKNWQPIYFYCEKNPREGCQPWKFKGFYNNYTIRATKISTAYVTNLRRANYFEDPSALIFNVNLDIIPQWNHILDDDENFSRIPEQIRNLGKQACKKLIDGAIRNVKDRIAANYKTVVPQYYCDRGKAQGRIQLLVPLYLTNEDTPDLALVLSLSKDKTVYYGHTCLTTEMAYNNARLIAKPDSEWLKP